jgi:protoporphyrinogen oxidase
MTSYSRRAVVRIGETAIPYPMQDHIDRLGTELAERIVAEQDSRPTDPPEEPTLEAWLLWSFGPTLSKVFFSPFNHRYTAGLTTTVAAQDNYKSPPPAASSRPSPRRPGYNARFLYPVGGLDGLAGAMAARCDIYYGKRVVGIGSGTLRFGDGTEVQYDQLVSTLPLNQAIWLSGIELEESPDPYTSVLVLNIGAWRGPNCPDAHWQYEPCSDSGFHRLGFYSNVDRSFLPARHRSTEEHVSIYVERAYLGGKRPTPVEAARFSDAAVAELQRRGYIAEVEVLDRSWVETAYTWRLPGSTWRDRAIDALARAGIRQVGRYATWHFQGIADSFRDGLVIGKELRGDALGAFDSPTFQ